ncbi:hypothetical protein, partial [Actinocorallia lasiicapitis]
MDDDGCAIGCAVFFFMLALALISVVLYFITVPVITVSSLGFAGYGIVLYTWGVAGALGVAGDRRAVRV